MKPDPGKVFSFKNITFLKIEYIKNKNFIVSFSQFKPRVRQLLNPDNLFLIIKDIWALEGAIMNLY